MNLYFSLSAAPGLTLGDMSKVIPINDTNILCSYEYKRGMLGYKPEECKRFMADSGAFTAMSVGKKIDADYVDGYIRWINENEIDQFIEMDLDEIIGYEATLELTKRIEEGTGKPSIPCWHVERGGDGWKRMCDNYERVAISMSNATGTDRWLASHNYEPLYFIIDEAHKRGAKVHAMGCASMRILRKFHFDSADSSRYNVGARHGHLLWFDGKELRETKVAGGSKTPSHIGTNRDAANIHNIKVFYKVTKYAERYLR